MGCGEDTSTPGETGSDVSKEGSADTMLRSFSRIWLRPLLVVFLAFTLWLVVGEFIGRVGMEIVPPESEWGRILWTSPLGGPVWIGSILEFLAALVGIAITVASILVQLSATRYTSRIINLFIDDKINLAVFVIYITTPLYGMWIAFFWHTFAYPAGTLLTFELLAVLDAFILLPYFSYLFYFLQPEKIVHKIQSSVRLSHLSPLASDKKIERLKKNLIASVTQLTDVVLNSLSQSDISVSLMSINTLKELMIGYERVKKRAPSIWHRVPRRAFPGLEDDRIRRLEEGTVWVELHCLKQFELIFVQSLNRFREVSAAIARRTRDVGLEALRLHELEALDLVIIFFNTYLRHALNALDVRTMFHTFYQYRLLAEGCADHSLTELLTKIASYFRYYGQEAERRGITFVIEIAAYDLRILVQRAYERCPSAVDSLLDVFLEVDRVPDEESERSQRGVRKSQALLAAFFLEHDEITLARRIHEDMLEESRERILSIGEELEAAAPADFWEIQDRGSNFYYVPQEMRRHLRRFFGWFEESSGLEPRE